MNDLTSAIERLAAAYADAPGCLCDYCLVIAAAARYRWCCERWDADSDDDLELFDNAMNSPDREAVIDAAIAASAPDKGAK